MLNFSDHVLTRMAQRNLSIEEVEFIVDFGKIKRKGGAVRYEMQGKNIPEYVPANDKRRQLEGSIVIISKCGKVVITAYRDGFKRNRRQVQYTRVRNYYWRELANCG